MKNESDYFIKHTEPCEKQVAGICFNFQDNKEVLQCKRSQCSLGVKPKFGLQPCLRACETTPAVITPKMFMLPIKAKNTLRSVTAPILHSFLFPSQRTALNSQVGEVEDLSEDSEISDKTKQAIKASTRFYWLGLTGTLVQL